MRSTLSLALLILFSTLVWPVAAPAQDTDASSIKFGPEAAPKLPADACFYGTLHMKEIVSMPELKLVPWEIISAAGIDNWGFDPLLIDRLDLIMGISDDPERPVRYTFVARTSNGIRLSDIKPMAIEPLKDLSPSLVQLNERFLLVGDLDYIKRVVNEPAADGELKRQVARIGDSSIAWFALVLAPMQKQLMEQLQKGDAEVRPDLELIAQKTKLLAARFDLKTQSVPVVLEANSEADAIAIEQTIKKLTNKMYEEQTARVEASIAGLPERVGEAVLQFKNRFIDEFQKVGQLTRKDARLMTTLDQNYYEVSQMSANLSIIVAALNGLQGM